MMEQYDDRSDAPKRLKFSDMFGALRGRGRA
jgi:hypothetical protein